MKQVIWYGTSYVENSSARQRSSRADTTNMHFWKIKHPRKRFRNLWESFLGRIDECWNGQRRIVNIWLFLMKPIPTNTEILENLKTVNTLSIGFSRFLIFSWFLHNFTICAKSYVFSSHKIQIEESQYRQSTEALKILENYFWTWTENREHSTQNFQKKKQDFVRSWMFACLLCRPWSKVADAFGSPGYPSKLRNLEN